MVQGNCDELIALGLGLVCGVKERKEEIKDYILTDICPFSLGVATINEADQDRAYMANIINRNTVLPCSRVRRFYTASDQQDYVVVEVHQGENTYAQDNLLLGKIEISVPPKPKGKEAVDVRFTYDINGILVVDTRVVSTGVVKTHIISQKIPEAELEERLKFFKDNDKLLEAERLEQRTRFDLEALRENGYCAGIENYSMHIDGRKTGQRPWNLFDYFPKDFLMFVDESHVSLPQVRGMYNGDRARKTILVDYGFRLPSALDNRPMTFDEFEGMINQVVYCSATPGEYELEKVDHQVVEQIIRPTGLLDPLITVKPTKGQIDDIAESLTKRIKRKERVLITTLTVRMAEDLTDYMKQLDIKVKYLHSDIDTLERLEIVRDLRMGVFDVLVGINLLREGLDIPEITLVAILDADKEGFLRSETSLVQTIGRAARNVDGHVIMYADTITDSMRHAIDETNRRRKIQDAYNKEHGITPQSIKKDIRDLISLDTGESVTAKKEREKDPESMTKKELNAEIARLTKKMNKAAMELNFEEAAVLRDELKELKIALRDYDD